MGRPWNGAVTASREQRGTYYTTVPKLVTNTDEDDLPNNRVGSFKNYFRLSKLEFDYVLQKVKSFIGKSDTTFRESICPEQRLMVTLRYLATGMSMTALHYDWRISVAAISQIVHETC